MSGKIVVVSIESPYNNKDSKILKRNIIFHTSEK